MVAVSVRAGDQHLVVQENPEAARAEGSLGVDAAPPVAGGDVHQGRALEHQRVGVAVGAQSDVVSALGPVQARAEDHLLGNRGVLQPRGRGQERSPVPIDHRPAELQHALGRHRAHQLVAGRVKVLLAEPVLSPERGVEGSRRLLVGLVLLEGQGEERLLFGAMEMIGQLGGLVGLQEETQQVEQQGNRINIKA